MSDANRRQKFGGSATNISLGGPGKQFYFRFYFGPNGSSLTFFGVELVNQPASGEQDDRNSFSIKVSRSDGNAVMFVNEVGRDQSASFRAVRNVDAGPPKIGIEMEAAYESTGKENVSSRDCRVSSAGGSASC